ncbi:phosphatase PAP2 family protein [Lentibacillus sp. N15]|uniref:phosphatase PAP2 family protein n=1 Tax=Lentibacillus songyuanensis TaxID=3136161 RepID=UPI0031BBBC58
MKHAKHVIYIFPLFLLLFLIVIWGIKAYYGMIPYIDQWTNGYVENLGGTTFYTFFRWLTELGSGTFLVPFVIVISVLVWGMHRDWFSGLMVIIGAFFCYLLNSAIKLIVARDRPEILPVVDAEGYSFPSGHSMLSVVCYGMFLYFVVRKLRTVMTRILWQIGITVLVLGIGISRYVIHVHYLTDVLAGLGMGFFFLTLWISIYKFIQKCRKAKTPS